MRKPLTPAMRWALEGIARKPRCTPSWLGEHMMNRPGFKHGKVGHLRSSQGMGRLGARMMRLLEDRGLILTHDAHTSGPTYRVARLTAEGFKELRSG